MLSLAVVLLIPSSQAIGYTLDSPDHPGSLFVHDDMFELNQRTTFLGEELLIQFGFKADEEAQMRLAAYQEHVQPGQRDAAGNTPGDGRITVPNLVHRWIANATWTIAGPGGATFAFTDDAENQDRGTTQPARVSQVVDLEPGINYEITGRLTIPRDLFGTTPDLTDIVWDLDGDGEYDEVLAWISVVAWPTRTVDPDVSGAYLDTSVVDTVLRMDVKPELEASFRSAPMTAEQKGVEWWPGTRTYQVPLDGFIDVSVNEDVLADFEVTGDLARLVLQVFIDGRPALDQAGNPLTWIPGQGPMKIRIPAGDHRISFIALTDDPGQFEGTVEVRRSNLIDETFHASVNVAPTNVGWPLIGMLTAMPLLLIVAGRRRYRFVEVPAWNAGVCTRGRKVIGVRDRGRVVRFSDLEKAAKSGDVSDVAERYGEPLAQQWLRRGKQGLQHRPLPHFAGKKAPRDVRSNATWSACRDCPARNGCWEPKRRQS